jgi:hypothetical protein
VGPFSRPLATAGGHKAPPPQPAPKAAARLPGAQPRIDPLRVCVLSDAGLQHDATPPRRLRLTQGLEEEAPPVPAACPARKE